MKNVVKVLMLISSAVGLTCSVAIAGNSGGGGVGVRCPIGPQSPKKFELLDLHEARLHGLKSNYNPRTESDAIDLTAGLFANHFWNPDTIPLKDDEEYMKAHIIRPILDGRPIAIPGENGKVLYIQYVPSLPLSNDIGQFNIAPGCHLEQIAYMDDATSTLKIARPNWNELDWLDKSALLSHEINYMMDRHDGIENFGNPPGNLTSQRTRAFNGMLFSTQGVLPKYGQIPGAGFKRCRNTDDKIGTYFWAFDSGPDQVTVVFSLIYNMDSSYQTYATFSGVNLSQLMDTANGNFYSIAPLSFSDEKDAPKFILTLTKAKGAAPLFSAEREQSAFSEPVGSMQPILCGE